MTDVGPCGSWIVNFSPECWCVSSQRAGYFDSCVTLSKCRRAVPPFPYLKYGTASNSDLTEMEEGNEIESVTRLGQCPVRSDSAAAVSYVMGTMVF